MGNEASCDWAARKNCVGAEELGAQIRRCPPTYLLDFLCHILAFYSRLVLRPSRSRLLLTE